MRLVACGAYQVFCGVYNMLLCEEDIIQELTSSDWSALAIAVQLSWALGMPSSSVSPTAALTRGADNTFAPSTARAAAASSKRKNTESTFVAFIIIVLLAGTSVSHAITGLNYTLSQNNFGMNDAGITA